jgi:hypothetical protein
MKHHHTALSFARSATFDRSSSNEGYIPLALRKYHDEKNFPIHLFRNRQGMAGKMLHNLLLRSTPNLKPDSAELLMRLASTPIEATLPIARYEGRSEQNVIIDRSLTLLNTSINFLGEGASANLTMPAGLINDDPIARTPIAIVGGGAAGIITYAALREVGFTKIELFEKRAQYGIWSQPNVNGGTKNNPRTLVFANRAQLETAAGNGTKDGAQVLSFLSVLAEKFLPSAVKKRIVSRIEPGQMSHRLIISEGDDLNFPIVINATGTGSPRPFDDHRRMRLSSNSERPQAVRWQVHDLKKEDAEGRRFIFIGLGNSTAEMISQIHDLQKKGVNCSYKILTHLTRDMIHNPSDAGALPNGKTARVFRDLSKPDLTGFQGDLPRSRTDYYKALGEGNIIPDVTSWGVIRNKLSYRQRNGTQHEVSYDKLYVLTGYQHTADDHHKMSVTVDADGAPFSDFDGEFRTAFLRYEGYFGIGAVMDGPSNRNATVIPGIMFRIPDLVYSVIMRAAQYQEAQII